MVEWRVLVEEVLNKEARYSGRSYPEGRGTARYPALAFVLAEVQVTREYQGWCYPADITLAWHVRR